MNQREADVYASFRSCIDFGLKSKPDLVLHAGDLFDAVRPTNRAISVAVEQLLRLSEAGIPCVVISGNHETPRLRETGNIFRVFDHLKGVYPVYGNRYEVVSLGVRGKRVAVHCVPQCLSRESFEGDMRSVVPSADADVNVLLAHGAVKGIAEFRMNECNEQYVPVESMSGQFDYVAMGHYHRFTRLGENAFYAGSTERFSFTEAGDEKGMLEVELGKRLTTRFVPVETRPMIDVPVIDCDGLGLDEIHRLVCEQVRLVGPSEKVVRVSLRGLPGHLARAVDVRGIRELCKSALHFELKVGTEKLAVEPVGAGAGSSLAVEFERFMQGQSVAEREVLVSLGLRYLRAADETEDVEVVV